MEVDGFFVESSKVQICSFLCVCIQREQFHFDLELLILINKGDFYFNVFKQKVNEIIRINQGQAVGCTVIMIYSIMLSPWKERKGGFPFSDFCRARDS